MPVKNNKKFESNIKSRAPPTPLRYSMLFNCTCNEVYNVTPNMSLSQYSTDLFNS